MHTNFSFQNNYQYCDLIPWKALDCNFQSTVVKNICILIQTRSSTPNPRPYIFRVRTFDSTYYF